jgi:adenosylcobinamide-GDP ribazoletransferase
MTGLIGAVIFLTRIPLRTRRALDTARSVPWFPMVGALIGALVGGAAALLEPWAAPGLAASFGLTIGLLVTGCFHEDGLGDVADAYVGGWNRDDRLRILKDSRHGTYGVVAIGASILLRASALGALVGAGPRVAVASAVTAHAMARVSALGVMTIGRPAVGEGLGADYVARLRRASTIIGMAAGTAIGSLAVGWWIIPAVVATFTVSIAMNAWTNRKIDGFSGDLLGATEQVAEIVLLIVFSIVAGHHQLWW